MSYCFLRYSALSACINQGQMTDGAFSEGDDPRDLGKQGQASMLPKNTSDQENEPHPVMWSR